MFTTFRRYFHGISYLFKMQKYRRKLGCIVFNGTGLIYAAWRGKNRSALGNPTPTPSCQPRTPSSGLTWQTPGCFRGWVIYIIRDVRLVVTYVVVAGIVALQCCRWMDIQIKGVDYTGLLCTLIIGSNYVVVVITCQCVFMVDWHRTHPKSWSLFEGTS